MSAYPQKRAFGGVIGMSASGISAKWAGSLH